MSLSFKALNTATVGFGFICNQSSSCATDCGLWATSRITSGSVRQRCKRPVTLASATPAAQAASGTFKEEARNAAIARRQALFGGIEGLDVGGKIQPVPSSRLGNPIAGALRMMGGGRQEPQAPSTPSRPAPEFNVMQGPAAPVGDVQGAPLPQIGMMPQDGGQDPRMGPVAPAPAQAAPMQADPSQIPPEIVQQAQRFLALGTPEGEQEALKLVQGWQQQQAMLAQMPPEIRNDPVLRYAFMQNPEAVAESIGYQYRPQVIAAGGIQSVIGSGDRVSAPQTIQFGDTLTRVDPLSPTPQTIATRGPTIAEQIDIEKLRQPQPVNVPAGSGLYGFSPNEPGGAVNPLVAPQAGNQGNAMERLAPQERGMIVSASNAASSARNRIRDLERYQTLNRERGTGMLPGMMGPVAGIDPVYAEMRQLEAKLTPREREAGSGPMSDRDLMFYNRAIPRIGNPGPTNDSIVAAGVAMSQRDIEYAGFLEEWAARNGTLLGSTESWQQYVDQNPLLEEGENNTLIVRQNVTPWRTYFGYGDQQRQSGPAQQGGGPVNVSTEDEYRRLPPGTRYIAPDGQVRTKQ